MNRAKFLERAKKEIQQALSKREIVLVRVNRAIGEMDNVINLLGERLEDIYVVYYPELKIPDKRKYSQTVMLLRKGRDSRKELSELFGSGKANEIMNGLERTTGGDISEGDVEKFGELAKEIIVLFELRENYEKYEEKLVEDVCPNMGYLLGPHLAAKLVAHLGSLKRLSSLPGSAIQLLGAEKALFKHLKSHRRTKPPKHGLIFQHPKISSSPKKVRGKIARTLAAKIATAAKADTYTKRFIAKELREQFEERFNSIMAEFSKGKTNEVPGNR